MEIVYKQKLTKIFPGVDLVIALSNGVLKKSYHIRVDEKKESGQLYSLDDCVEITVTTTDHNEVETDHVSTIFPQLYLDEDADAFAKDYPHLVVKPREEGPYFLSAEARRSGTMFLTLTNETSSTMFLHNDAKNDDEEMMISLYEDAYTET